MKEERKAPLFFGKAKRGNASFSQKKKVYFFVVPSHFNVIVLIIKTINGTIRFFKVSHPEKKNCKSMS